MKIISFLLLSLFLLLHACSPLTTIVSSSGEQPTPVEMEEGTYTITVNGTSTTLDLPPSP